jgi:hypothetical protein
LLVVVPVLAATHPVLLPALTVMLGSVEPPSVMFL